MRSCPLSIIPSSARKDRSIVHILTLYCSPSGPQHHPEQCFHHDLRHHEFGLAIRGGAGVQVRETTPAVGECSPRWEDFFGTEKTPRLRDLMVVIMSNCVCWNALRRKRLLFGVMGYAWLKDRDICSNVDIE